MSVNKRGRVVVAGATVGIGERVVGAFERDGFEVLVPLRSEEKVASLLSALPPHAPSRVDGEGPIRARTLWRRDNTVRRIGIATALLLLVARANAQGSATDAVTTAGEVRPAVTDATQVCGDMKTDRHDDERRTMPHGAGNAPAGNSLPPTCERHDEKKRTMPHGAGNAPAGNSSLPDRE